LNRKLRVSLLFLFLVGIGLSFHVVANSIGNCDNNKQGEIIDSVTSAFNRFYVFEDVANKMDEHLHKRFQNGEYKNTKNRTEFLRTLVRDMRIIKNDQHINIYYRSDKYFEKKKEKELTEEEINKKIEEEKRYNYTFEKIEILPGNVGYMKFDRFRDATYAGSTAVGALNFLGNADAIIIDLRDNGGGEPNMVQLIASYFFDERTHFNSLVTRGEGTEEQLWTYAHVSGPRLTGKDVYILVSYDTFSAGEALAYHLQKSGKATVVGDSTGTGAHPCKYIDMPHLNIVIKVPYQRAVSPFTNSNWEGIGIQPDIEVPSYKAFDVAYLHAVMKLREKGTDEQFNARLDWLLPALESNVNPVFVDEEILKSYVGQYGPIRIFYDHNSLYFEYRNRRQMKMYSMSENKFRCGVYDEYRIEFHLDDNGNPCAGTISFEDGTVFKEPKT
jgi:C-terminal processing protease CtpA/Prc